MDVLARENLIKNISKKYNNFNLKSLSEDQLNMIAKLLMVDKAKSELNNEIKKENFDIDFAIDIFLQSGKSDNTRIIYKRAIDYFIDNIDTHILDITAKEVDILVNKLTAEESLSNATKRLYISALSSFFSMLKRHDVVENNYFYGARLPKKERKRSLKVPTDDDVNIIRSTILSYENATGKGSYLLRASAKKNLIIFDLLVKTGIRVGAISTISIGHNNVLSGVSKGKKFKIQIDNELAKRLKSIDLKSVKERAVQKFIEKVCKDAGVISYHPHSFRHYFAITEYEKDKDIYRLKMLLNHASVSVTETYLKSIGIL